MLRRWLKKITPKHDEIKNHKHLSWLGKILHDPNLWHLNRKSVPLAVAIGLFIGFLPLPMQMLTAALLAILFRVNLPISVALTWATNPLTFIPINYAIYKVGNVVLGKSSENIVVPNVEWKLDSLIQLFLQFGKAFFVGLPIVAIGAAVIGYILAVILWRLGVIIQLYYRKKRIKR